jgi:transcriptional regulator with GAF, ATPase, and Fis domain
VAGPLAAALERCELEKQINELTNHLQARSKYQQIIGESTQIKNVIKFIDQAADTSATVMIEGETGTGKELVARALHDNSRRRLKPFVSLNCGAITETLLESELFGHVKGAFTGAVQNKKGWFETADQGTIFFDEIGEMSPGLQVKLLRILQKGEFSPVGGNKTITCNVRILVASNRNLESMVKQGSFRADLFYRLNILNIYLPPLRERREDILLLCAFFLQQFCLQQEKETIRLGPGVQEVLRNYEYPGNIRELENAMQRIVVLAESGEAQLHHLPPHFLTATSQQHDKIEKFNEIKKIVLERFEHDYFATTLERANGVIAHAAKLAGMDAKNFRQKMIKYRIKSSRG